MDSESKPVDHPSRETVEVRQGTGPRETVSVLFISLARAVMAGIGFAAVIMLAPCSPEDWALAAALA
jgi:hypothetical protein